MSNDWVASIYYTCVITSLIEHTHIQVQNICQIYSTLCSTLIWADRHHVVTVDDQVIVAI